MTEASKRRPRVAIDGPAGAGKSTVARGLAERLGYVLVDTGAIYRTVALAARREGVAWDDAEALGKLAEALVADGAIKLERTAASPQEAGAPRAMLAAASGLRVVLRGEDVSGAIRTPEISAGASRVSAVPAVRASLLDLQRQAGDLGGVVLEGRDIGTVVFPDAVLKAYLTARLEVRAGRRHREVTDLEYEAVEADMARRDTVDTERDVDPLQQVGDAVVIDTSDRSVEEIVADLVERL